MFLNKNRCNIIGLQWIYELVNYYMYKRYYTISEYENFHLCTKRRVIEAWLNRWPFTDFRFPNGQLSLLFVTAEALTKDNGKTVKDTGWASSLAEDGYIAESGRKGSKDGMALDSLQLPVLSTKAHGQTVYKTVMDLRRTRMVVSLSTFFASYR